MPEHNQKIKITKDDRGWSIFVDDIEIPNITGISIDTKAPDFFTKIVLTIWQPDKDLELTAD